MVTSLVVDAHAISEEELLRLLRDKGHSTVWQTTHKQETLEAIGLHSPDVVIIDMDGGNIDGVALVKTLRAKGILTPVLAVSGQIFVDYAQLCASSGASGFVDKRTGLTQLCVALDAIASGASFFPLALKGSPLRKPPGLSRLSIRECETLHFLAKGLSPKEIAARMKVKSRTVKTFKSRLMKKLGLSTPEELEKYLSDGSLPLDR